MSIDLSIEHGVAEILLNRPEKMNALDAAHLHDLRRALVEASTSPDVRVVVVKGAGGKAFSAGADLGASSKQESVLEAFARDDVTAAELGLYVRLLELGNLGLRKPLIAAVQGYCLGGGLEIALQCDIMLASESAQFGLPEVGVGSIPGAGGVTRLLAAIPRAVATDMMLTGRRINAARALQVGLVSDVIADRGFEEHVRRRGQEIAELAPLALQMIKMLAQQTPMLPVPAALQLTELAWGLVRDSDDRLEGRLAFKERRKPKFRGA